MERHEVLESRVVAPLQEVNQLMDHDILKAFGRLFRQLKAEPEAPGHGIAAAPSGLHPSHAPKSGFHAKLRLPLRDQRGDFELQPLAVPAVEEVPPMPDLRSGAQGQLNRIGPFYSDAFAPRDFPDGERVASSLKPMRLALRHLPFRLAHLARELLLVALDPREALDHRQPDGLFAHPERDGQANPAVRRIDGDMQMPNDLADDLDLDAGHVDEGRLNNLHAASQFREWIWLLRLTL